tara:strand:- start:105 stop:923 length:819 start_codon:yes stop_codon:yes gene_type:complete
MKELQGRKLILILGIPFGIGLCLIGNPFFSLVTSLIMIAGLDEFYTICEKKGTCPNRIFGFIISILISISYSGIYAHHQITIMGVICLSVISVFIIEIINDKEGPLLNISTTFLGILFVPIMLGTVIYIRQLDHIYNSNIILTLFLSVWLCDTSAFFFGTKWGNKKILPRISPKKSWVGAISGFITSLLVFIVSHHFGFLGNKYYLVDGIIIGSISGIFSQLGDFAESLLKRDAGVKDSGNILRAHGGILDRFDSLLFSSPMVYIYLLIFAY